MVEREFVSRDVWKFCKMEGVERKFIENREGDAMVCTHCRFKMSNEKEVERE